MWRVSRWALEEEVVWELWTQEQEQRESRVKQGRMRQEKELRQHPAQVQKAEEALRGSGQKPQKLLCLQCRNGGGVG